MDREGPWNMYITHSIYFLSEQSFPICSLLLFYSLKDADRRQKVVPLSWAMLSVPLLFCDTI